MSLDATKGCDGVLRCFLSAVERNRTQRWMKASVYVPIHEIDEYVAQVTVL